MVSPRQQLDIDALVKDPADHFATPMDVVNDARLNKDEKKRVLESATRSSYRKPKRKTCRARTARVCRKCTSHSSSCRSASSRAARLICKESPCTSRAS